MLARFIFLALSPSPIMLRLLLASLLAFTTACVSFGPRMPDAEPMLGGVTRPPTAEEQAQIDQVIAQKGSRRAAAGAHVDWGFNAYQANDLKLAMDEFNRAWLIDPTYSESYWGFASIKSDLKAYGEANDLMQLALDRGLTRGGALADAGLIRTNWARTAEGLSDFDREQAFRDSDALFTRATNLAPNDPYAYYLWARALALRGDAERAIQKAEFAQSLGMQLQPDFRDQLRALAKENS